jgi:hypothetical protein
MVNMIFGAWNGRWGWRVEWKENGKLKFQDFIQKDLRPGEAKAEAQAFKEHLLRNAVAA